jgi:hypothetical protein
VLTAEAKTGPGRSRLVICFMYCPVARCVACTDMYSAENSCFADHTNTNVQQTAKPSDAGFGGGSPDKTLLVYIMYVLVVA